MPKIRGFPPRQKYGQQPGYVAFKHTADLLFGAPKRLDMTTAEKKPRKPHLKRWQPGQSGNPKGREKGSRNKLSERFLQDFYDAWEQFGRGALEVTASVDPSTFVKVAASLLPKELHVRDTTLDDISEDELLTMLSAIRSQISAGIGKKAGQGSQEAGVTAELDRVH